MTLRHHFDTNLSHNRVVGSIGQVSEKALEKPVLKDFVDYFMKNAARLVVEANDVPLPARAYSENLERITAKKVGSVYGGEDRARPRPLDMRKVLEALMHGS